MARRRLATDGPEAQAILKAAQARGAQLKVVLVIEASMRLARERGEEPARATMTRVFNRLVAEGQLTEHASGRRPTFVLGPNAPYKPRADKVPLAVERCLFPSPRRDALRAARTAIRKRFEVVDDTRTSLAFRWRYTARDTGPRFQLEATDTATLERYIRGANRTRLARMIGSVRACLVLAFDDLRQVLDETNGLIEAQAVIAAATRGPVFNAWNGELFAIE